MHYTRSSALRLAGVLAVGLVIRAVVIGYQGLHAYTIAATAMDLIDAVLLYLLVRHIAGERWSVAVAALFVLNPAVIFVSAVRGEADSIAIGFAVGSTFLFLLSRKCSERAALSYTAAAWIVLGCAVAFQPIAAVLAPLFLAFSLWATRGVLAPMISGAACIFALVWAGHQYAVRASAYPYNSVNAFNLWAILHPFWQSDSQLIGPLAQYVWGAGLVLAATMLIVFRFLQLKSDRAFIEAAALLGLAVFVLATRMHEQDIYLGLVFAIAAAALAPRYACASLVFSATLLLNLLYSTQYLSVVGHAVAAANQADLWGWPDHGLALVNVATFFWIAYSYLGEGAAEPAPAERGVLRSIRGFFPNLRADSREGTHVFAWPYDYVVCAALSGLSFVILAYRYWFPPQKIFDEVYFARAAEEYLHRQYIYENTHPPVTKLLITLSTLMFGDTSYGWRFLDVVFGSLAVWLLYALIKRITGSTLFSAFGAGLFMCDGMHYVQSRIATPESFVVVFALASLYTLYRYWTASQMRSEPTPPLRVWRLRAIAIPACIVLAGTIAAVRFEHESGAAKVVVGLYACAALYLLYRMLVERRFVPVWLALFALSLALLVASKWYGVMAFGVALSVVVLVWATRRTRAWGSPQAFSLDVMIATIAFVVGTVYFASYTPQFIGLSDTPGAPPRAYMLTDVIDMQYSAFEYHSHLQATHPYQSRWWQWPLDLRPILYYAKYGRHGNASTAGMIYTLPNPLILWAGLLTVPIVAYLAIRERNKGYLLLALAYVAQWLPWIGSPRISFAYHFYVDVPLICACTAIVAQRLCAAVADAHRPMAYALTAGYFAAVVASFAYFYPILSGTPIPTGAWMQRMWLRSWI